MPDQQVARQDDGPAGLTDVPTGTDSFTRDYTIRAVSLDEQDLGELFDLLAGKMAEAREIEIAAAIENQDGEEPIPRDVLEERADRGFQISYSIRDPSSRLGISGTGKPDLNSANVGNELGSFYLSTGERFKKNFAVLPRNCVDIFIDFKRTPMAINFLNLPSNPTENGSCLNVYGDNEQWVIATHQVLVEFFDQRKSKWGWLHGSGVYDAFIFLFIVPFLLIKAYQFETNPTSWAPVTSNVALIGIYVYAYLVAVNVGRIGFLGARWLFPTVEFISSRRTSPVKYRLLAISVAFALLVWALQSVISVIS